MLSPEYKAIPPEYVARAEEPCIQGYCNARRINDRRSDETVPLHVKRA